MSLVKGWEPPYDIPREEQLETVRKAIQSMTPADAKYYYGGLAQQRPAQTHFNDKFYLPWQHASIGPIKLSEPEKKASEKREPVVYGKEYKPGDSASGKYILWCPTSPEAPKYVFDDRPSAIKASYAMASRYPQQEFFVCKLVGKTKAQDVHFSDFGG